jgi:hypothetical protein
VKILGLSAVLALVIVWPRSHTTELSGVPDRVVHCSNGTTIYVSPETPMNENVCD